MKPAIKGDISYGGWSARCQPSGQEAAIDPIKNFGTTAPHTHEFFAPTAVQSTTHPSDLVTITRTMTVCNGPSLPEGTPAGGCTYQHQICDMSAYWAPELLYDTDPTNPAATASPITPAFVNVYFRNEYVNPASISPFPTDYAAVAGNATATAAQSPWIINWQCVDDNAGDNGGKKIESGDRYTSPILPSPSCELPAHLNAAGLPDPADPEYLRLVVTFPECVQYHAQNGMEIPSPATYQISSPTPPPPSTTYETCPSGYNSVPTIQLGFHWLLTPSLTSTHTFFPWTITHNDATCQKYGVSADCINFTLNNIWLSSDLMMEQMGMTVAPGMTAHADFENGYTSTDLNALVTQCIHNGDTCGLINGDQ